MSLAIETSPVEVKLDGSDVVNWVSDTEKIEASASTILNRLPEVKVPLPSIEILTKSPVPVVEAEPGIHSKLASNPSPLLAVPAKAVETELT